MSIAGIVAVFLVLISVAYFSYGRWISKILGLDDKRITPAHKVNDGEDFVPTKTFYLFGQHFSAIAAAGPIAGPIAACLAFGWVPCLLWIALGVVLIGAVHDFTSWQRACVMAPAPSPRWPRSASAPLQGVR